MALTDKLTAIGNAIRAKTGGSSQLTLAQMATEISNIPTGSTNCKCQKVTVATDKTDRIVLTSADSDIAAHRTDNNFYVGIVPLFPYSSGLSIRGGINTNRNLIEDTNNPIYGFLMRITGSGSNSFAFITKSATTAGGEISTTANGEIFFYATTTYVLRAGDYLVVSGWNQQ